MNYLNTWIYQLKTKVTGCGLLTMGCLIIMEGLGIWGYFTSRSGLKSTSRSSSSELWESLRQAGGDSKHRLPSLSCRWQIEFVPFAFVVLVEWVEMQLTVLLGCLCCCSGLLGRASGWDTTGSAAGGPWSHLLRLELFGSWEGAGSVLTSDGLPKQCPRDEQGSPCMLADLKVTKKKNKANPTCTDIRWIWGFPECGATLNY